MANHPAEGNMVMLNVRIATPPPGVDAPPGVASSATSSISSRATRWSLSGPYGEFFVKDTDARDALHRRRRRAWPRCAATSSTSSTRRRTARKVSFWYGARSRREMFYDEEFQAIANEFPNFTLHRRAQRAAAGGHWDGPTGFIHSVVLDHYLQNHPDPTEIEYYLCGPPLMLAAVNKMLYDLGVEKDMIAFDEFG